jgi:hypothetical protein
MLYFQQVRKGDPKRAGGLSALGSWEKTVPPRSPKVAGEDEEKPYAQVMQSTDHEHSEFNHRAMLYFQVMHIVSLIIGPCSTSRSEKVAGEDKDTPYVQVI